MRSYDKEHGKWGILTHGDEALTISAVRYNPYLQDWVRVRDPRLPVSGWQVRHYRDGRMVRDTVGTRVAALAAVREFRQRTGV